MPVVQVSIWAGMNKRAKMKIAEDMTRVLTEMGIPREEVTVILRNTERELGNRRRFAY